MKKIIAIAATTALALTLSGAPATAAACPKAEKKSVMALLVPVTEISLYLGTNLEKNSAVRAEVNSIRKKTKSKKLKRALMRLDGMIQVGELRPGSAVFWGGGKNSVLDMYSKARKIVRKNKC